jgi:hypothetical protein
MVTEFVDLPTDVLLDLVVGILDVGRLLTPKDVAELEELEYELQRRLETKGCEC